MDPPLIARNVFIAFLLLVPGAGLHSLGRTPGDKTSAPSLPTHPLKAFPGLYLTSKAGGLRPETTFPCEGTVFAHLAFSTQEEGIHQLEGVWRAPDGGVQERPRVELDFKPGSSRRAVIYIHLKEPGYVGVRTSQRNSFEGRWALEVYCDGILVSQTPFTVACR